MCLVFFPQRLSKRRFWTFKCATNTELCVCALLFFCCFYFPPSWAPKKLIYLEMCDLPGEAWECLWLILWWEWQCLLQRLSSSQTAADEQTTAQINNMRKNAIYCKVLCDLEIFVLTVCSVKLMYTDTRVNDVHCLLCAESRKAFFHYIMDFGPLFLNVFCILVFFPIFTYRAHDLVMVYQRCFSKSETCWSCGVTPGAVLDCWSWSAGVLCGEWELGMEEHCCLPGSLRAVSRLLLSSHFKMFHWW